MKRSGGMAFVTALQVAGLAAGLGVAGCATAPKNENALTKTNLDLHPIKVHQDTARLEIGVRAEDATLRAEDMRALSAFAADYKERGRGPVVMSVPAGDAAAKLAEDVRRNLYGILPSDGQVSVASYDAGAAPAPIVLSYERYVAEIKDCPSNGATNTAVSWDNKPMAGLGCSINTNIAMMLADPGDVVSPPDMSPSNAGRRGDVFEKYRNGLPTGVIRTNDERGAVSTAVGQ